MHFYERLLVTIMSSSAAAAATAAVVKRDWKGGSSSNVLDFEDKKIEEIVALALVSTL